MAHQFWFLGKEQHNRFYFQFGLPCTHIDVPLFGVCLLFPSLTSTLSSASKNTISIDYCENGTVWQLLPETYTKLGISGENCTNMRRPLTIARPNSP